MLIASLKKVKIPAALKDRLGFYFPFLAIILIAQNVVAQVNHQAVLAETSSKSSKIEFANLPHPSVIKSIAQAVSPTFAPTSTPQTLSTGKTIPRTPAPTPIPQTKSLATTTPIPSTPTPTPAPLITYQPDSIQGILSATNKQREDNNLSALTLNSTLSQAAKARVADMFEKEYFSHNTPSGGSYVDFVNAAHYTWHTVEENLASGDPAYVGDEKVVSLWMDSPGHRANILSNNVSEIGIAVGEGMYKGKHTWIAVQLFGAP